MNIRNIPPLFLREIMEVKKKARRNAESNLVLGLPSQSDYRLKQHVIKGI